MAGPQLGVDRKIAPAGMLAMSAVSSILKWPHLGWSMRWPVLPWCEPRPTPGRLTGHSHLWRCARERRDAAAPSTWACEPCTPAGETLRSALRCPVTSGRHLTLEPLHGAGTLPDSLGHLQDAEASARSLLAWASFSGSAPGRPKIGRASC